MNSRKLFERGGDCIRQMWPMLVWATPTAWGQAANPAPAAAAPKPAVAQEATHSVATPPRLNLYLGHAEDLLSDTQWQNLLVTQAIEDTEPTSDSRDWSDSGTREIKVEAVKVRPQVPDGVGGLIWAIRHPVQAWRVLVPSSQ